MTRTAVRTAFVITASCVLWALTPSLGAQSAATAPEVTFAKDVAPILQRSCQACHRPEGMAPMSLLTYEQVRPWARAIKLKVATRVMPPWYVDRTVGVQHFKNDQSLNDREIATITRWVDAGAPLGNPADLPKPPAGDGEYRWNFPGGDEPDLVVQAPPFTTRANANETWINLDGEFSLPEDRWVKAYEARPSKEGIPVVHHITATPMDSATNDLTEVVGEMAGLQYAPGKPATVYPEGIGFLLKAGKHRLRFNMHYSSTNKTVTDQSMVGFKFYPKGYTPKKEALRVNWVSTEDLDLPAGEDNIRTDDYAVVHENMRLLSYLPHFHIRGKRQCVEFIYPNGRVETMNCFDFNFSWQIVYQYAEDAQPLIPKGTVIHAIHWHDNSANKRNPDPKNWAGYGNRTVDEMAFTLAEAITLTDEEFAQAVQERERQQQGTVKHP